LVSTSPKNSLRLITIYTTTIANTTIINFCNKDILRIPSLFVTESNVFTVEDDNDEILELTLEVELEFK
jgi:hypothetical protein